MAGSEALLKRPADGDERGLLGRPSIVVEAKEAGGAGGEGGGGNADEREAYGP